jgi:hypothetical protein
MINYYTRKGKVKNSLSDVNSKVLRMKFQLPEKV